MRREAITHRTLESITCQEKLSKLLMNADRQNGQAFFGSWQRTQRNHQQPIKYKEREKSFVHWTLKNVWHYSAGNLYNTPDIILDGGKLGVGLADFLICDLLYIEDDSQSLDVLGVRTERHFYVDANKIEIQASHQQGASNSCWLAHMHTNQIIVYYRMTDPDSLRRIRTTYPHCWCQGIENEYNARYQLPIESVSGDYDMNIVQNALRCG